MIAKLYEKWSPYNFNATEWREAAQRYVELMEYMRSLQAEHLDGDHGDFVRCETCEELHHLDILHDQFAAHFAPSWARKLIELNAAVTA